MGLTPLDSRRYHDVLRCRDSRPKSHGVGCTIPTCSHNLAGLLRPGRHAHQPRPGILLGKGP